MIDNKSIKQLQVLRGRLEANLSRPALISVSSASDGDGKSVVSYGLARSFSEAGYRVLLVDANPAKPELASAPRIANVGSLAQVDINRFVARVADTSFDGMSVADDAIAASTSLDMVRSMREQLLAAYDYVIVDNASCDGSNLALMFCTVADGTLMAVRKGRAVAGGDEQAIAAIAQCGADLLGVVTIAPDTIKAFARADRSCTEARTRVGDLVREDRRQPQTAAIP